MTELGLFIHHWRTKMDATQTVSALSALAHETRLAVFRMLVQAGPTGRTAGVLAEALEVAPPPLSFHLKELAHAGLVVARREGRNIHYSANFEVMNGLIAYLTDNCCGGMPCAVEVGGVTCC